MLSGRLKKATGNSSPPFAVSRKTALTTSRMSRPIVRTYQDEQDQQLIFLLDCGRNMRLQMEGKSHFDHALQAMLLLSYTALKHGDAAGLLTFAHPVARFVPPHKGMEQLGRLV